MSQARYQTEFPEFPALPEFDALPYGFNDSSWSQDSCPSANLCDAEGKPLITIWIDHPEEAKREDPSLTRFAVVLGDPCSGDASLNALHTDDWAEVLDCVEASRPHGQHFMGFEHEGTHITNPTASTCGRFSVEPVEYGFHSTLIDGGKHVLRRDFGSYTIDLSNVDGDLTDGALTGEQFLLTVSDHKGKVIGVWMFPMGVAFDADDEDQPLNIVQWAKVEA